MTNIEFETLYAVKSAARKYLSKDGIVLDFMKVISPVMAQEGIKLQNRIVEQGGDPSHCTIGGKDIPTAYAESALEWAKAFAQEYCKYEAE